MLRCQAYLKRYSVPFHGRGGISDDKEISMCISADHKTTKNLLARKAFTISMGDAAEVEF